MGSVVIATDWPHIGLRILLNLPFADVALRDAHAARLGSCEQRRAR